MYRLKEGLSITGPSVSEEPIRSSSGIDYRLHGMTVPARPYAKRGLQTHGIMLLHCMRDDENGKYRFQLRDVEPVEIAIPDAPRETQCNCGGNTQNHACKVALDVSDSFESGLILLLIGLPSAYFLAH